MVVQELVFEIRPSSKVCVRPSFRLGQRGSPGACWSRFGEVQRSVFDPVFGLGSVVVQELVVRDSAKFKGLCLTQFSAWAAW